MAVDRQGDRAELRGKECSMSAETIGKQIEGINSKRRRITLLDR